MKRDEEKDRRWLQTLVKRPSEEKKRRWPLHYLLLLGCVGIVLMIAGNLMTNSGEGQEDAMPALQQTNEEDEAVFKTKSEEDAKEPSTMEDYERKYENQLREVLEEIIGISDVSVMINLAETERHVYEKNTNSKQQTTDETDREGGTRKVEDLNRDEQLVIVRNGEREEPILIQKEKPDIRGVLVVAKGVENSQIKGWVVEAVSRVLDVPAHRVSVMPKKTKGDVS